MASSFTLRRLTEETPFDTSDLDKRLAEIKGRISKLQNPERLQEVAPQPFKVESKLPMALGILSAAAARQQQNYSGTGVNGPGTNGLTFGQANPEYMKLGSSVYSAVKSLFPSVSNGGQFVARNIRGTNTPSEHAYGAAVDIMVPNKAVGDKVYSWLQANQGQFGYSSLLWQIPDHYNHIHVGWLY